MQVPVKILFLHHSTGNNIWKGNANRYLYKIFKNGQVPKWFETFNKRNGSEFQIRDQVFPKASPYGWKNYPYDYYNIWVKNDGLDRFMDEPSLEELTHQFQVIVFKHCFPVSNILPDKGVPDVNSEERTLENYKTQYNLLKEKLHTFPQTKFIIWTNPALVEKETTPENARRAREFHDWVVNEWATYHDNIFLFDFYALETVGGLFMKNEYAVSFDNSHPNQVFSTRVAPLFCERIVDVVLNNK